MVTWISTDWASDPIRFIVEITAWILSIGCSLTMAITVPDPPLIFLYPTWIASCLMYLWAAHNRRSFGMVINYALLTVIDIVGLVKIILSQ